MSRSRLRRWVDVGVPVAVGLLLVMVALETDEPAALKLVGVLAGAGQGAALWWRRSHPELVMGVALVGALLFLELAPTTLFPFAGLVALGSLAAARTPRRSLPALAALLGVTALNYPIQPTDDVTFAMVFPVVAWALGEATRNRRVAIAEAARRAAGEEQARIARELHDVIAHSVSVIVVQAAAADDVFGERPDEARAALRSIESAGRDALADLRRLLAAVRPGPGEDGEAERPQPGLERLTELAEPLRAAGLEVALRREGATAALPAGVDLSAYRIVPEALTNTLRHAGATRAEVTVRAAGSTLEIDVRDDGRGQVSHGSDGARGIAGMRERAAMLGGAPDAGPLPDGGGFRVHARLPLEAAR